MELVEVSFTSYRKNDGVGGIWACVGQASHPQQPSRADQ